MESFVRDLRFGWRSLWRSPGFTLVAVLTLGLGVGANAAIISLVWSILFRPLPFSEPENLQVILQEGRQGLSSISLPDLEDLKSRNRVYDSVALVREVDRNLSNGIDPAKRVKGLLVSWEFLNTLGVDLHMGRGFLQDEDRLGANPTALLSHSLWQGHFGSDPSLLGQVIQLDGEPFTVIGVLPPALEREPIAPGALLGDLWLPIGLYSDQMEPEERASRKGVFALGRLKDGVSRWDAASDLGRISRELATEYPLSNKNYRFHADTFRDSQLGSDRTALFAALMMVVLVLLIACTNLVNLILSRHTQRRREFRIRAALGAEQSRIVQLLLAENLLWGLLGGILGGFLALEILRILPSKLDGLLHSLSLTELGRIATLVWPVALLLGLLVGVGIGVLPAWRASRLSTLPQSSWGRAFGTGLRLRRTLIVFELALATVALIAAGLILRSVENLLEEDLGFRSENLLISKVIPPQAKFLNGPEWLALFEQSANELQRLPGSEDVAVTSHVPIADLPPGSLVAAGDRALPEMSEVAGTAYQAVSANYFELLGIPLLQGRTIDALTDHAEAAKVVVLSESLAREFWDLDQAIGQRLAFEFDGSPANPIPRWREVIGVVGDVHLNDLRDDQAMVAYVPLTQRPSWWKETLPISLLTKTKEAPAALFEPARRALNSVSPDSPVYEVRSLSSVVDVSFGIERDFSTLLLSLGLLALILAVVGIWGLINLMVSVRVREICIRIALGAREVQLFWALLEQSLRLAFGGVILGFLLAALSAGPLLNSRLYGVEVLDLRTYALVGCLMIAIAVLATLPPAWRALRVDPANELRAD